MFLKVSLMKYLKATACIFLSVTLTALLAPAQDSPKASLQGRVVDLFGSPLSDAEIEISGENQADKFRARSGPDGGYQISNLPAGQHTISARLRGFREEKKTLVLAGGEQASIDFGLEVGRLTDLPETIVSGYVQDEGRKPLQNATVTLVNAFNYRLTFQARSDKEGRYAFRVSNPGQYIVIVSKSGFMVNAKAILVPAKEESEKHIVDFLLSPLSLL